MAEWYQQQSASSTPSRRLPVGNWQEMDAAAYAADSPRSISTRSMSSIGTIWDWRPKSFSFSDESKSVPRDLLADYLPEAHRRGIKVFVYMNVHWAGKLYLTEHPDWVQRKRDGSAADGACMAAAARRSAPTRPGATGCLKLIDEMTSAYEIDGIFLDGPAFFEGTCYCERAKARLPRPLWRRDHRDRRCAEPALARFSRVPL